MPASALQWAGWVVMAVVLAAGSLLPSWAMFLCLMGLAKGLVVLGLMVLWRTGLVSFGQALFYGLGAYTIGLLPMYTGITDVFLLIVSAVIVSTAVAVLLGFLLRRYRDIFFAMLCLAFSMILYGVLVHSETLGSTDGFNIVQVTYLGFAPQGRDALVAHYLVTAAVVLVAALLVHRYLRSTMGRLTTAIRDNELRVEYLGFSVKRAIHFKFVLAGALAGAGGGLAAVAIGHIDPDAMTYWTVSGEFVFVTILSGTGHVVAPFIGAIVFEALRSFAFAYAPHLWQAILGGSLLLVIIFLPGGLWSLVGRYRRERADVTHPRHQELA